MTFGECFQALASKRLAVDRRAFHELSSHILSYILNLWHSLHQSLLSQIAHGAKETPITLEKAILGLKILRKLTIHGLKKPHEHSEAMAFITKLFEEARTMLQLRKTIPVSMKEPIEKYIVLHAKIWYDLLESHPFSFVPHIQTALGFICSLCFTEQGDGLLFQRFTIFCLNLIKGKTRFI